MPRHPLFDAYYYLHKSKVHFQFHCHPQYEIYYFHEGKCDYLIGDRIIPLVPGDLIIMDGMTQHCPRVDTRYNYVRSMISFNPSVVKTLKSPANGLDLLLPFDMLRHHHVRLEGEAKEECEQNLHRMSRFYRTFDSVGFNRLVLAFFDLLIFVYARCEPAMNSLGHTVTEKERNVRKVMAYIENGYSEDITLDAMEKELHISKQYMSKIFREITGMTIFDYLYRRRVSQAKQLFYLQRNRSVTDVCFQVGFKSVSHFSRLFKAHVGMTPDRYRRLLTLQAVAGEEPARGRNREDLNSTEAN